jgi:hypothetical protein
MLLNMIPVLIFKLLLLELERLLLAIIRLKQIKQNTFFNVFLRISKNLIFIQHESQKIIV